MNRRRCRSTTALWIAALAIGLTATAARAQHGDRLVGLDGRTTEARVLAIDASGEVELAGGETVALDALRRIERGVAIADPAADAHRLYLTDGGRLLADRVQIDGGRVTFDWAAGEAERLPLAAVRGVRLAPESPASDEAQATSELAPAFADALADRDDPQDKLFVHDEPKLTVVAGVLEALGPERVQFVWRDESRTLDRAKLYGLTLAVTGREAGTPQGVMVHLADGSRIGGKLLALADGRLRLGLADRDPLALDWAQVARIEVRSGRMVFLSDLEPTEQLVEALVTYPWPPQVDRSVMGEPLRIGERTFEKGIGTHAETRLSWSLDGDYDTFAAVIGIDAETEGRGDCIFRVLVDGQERLRQRMTGPDAALPIRVSIAGARSLTLITEPGENLDIADHANWADARLIREAP